MQVYNPCHQFFIPLQIADPYLTPVKPVTGIQGNPMGYAVRAIACGYIPVMQFEDCPHRAFCD